MSGGKLKTGGGGLTVALAVSLALHGTVVAALVLALPGLGSMAPATSAASPERLRPVQVTFVAMAPPQRRAAATEVAAAPPAAPVPPPAEIVPPEPPPEPPNDPAPPEPPPEPPAVEPPPVPEPVVPPPAAPPPAPAPPRPAAPAETQIAQALPIESGKSDVNRVPRPALPGHVLLDPAARPKNTAGQDPPWHTENISRAGSNRPAATTGPAADGPAGPVEKPAAGNVPSIAPPVPGDGRPAAFTPAAVLSLPTPEYPPRSRRLGEEGSVLLEVEVLPDGRAGRVRVLQAPPHARLTEAAIEAVRQARFRPATAGGVPVRSVLEVPIRFRLD